MGYLLGAINQTELDEQRGVVRNEKRMKQGQPLVTMRQRIASHLYPAGHPYGHELFGSMADFDAAGLDKVRAFFRAYDGPNKCDAVADGRYRPADGAA